jgi:hypothetical protein
MNFKWMIPLLLHAALFAQIVSPPSVPTFPVHNKEKKEDPCRLVPPMIVNLPPPLEEARSACVLERMKPDMRYILVVLRKKFGEDLQVINVKGVMGFSDLYAIDLAKSGKRSTLFCDSMLKHCIEGKRKW